MKDTKYTPQELEIVDYIENSNPKSIPNLEEELELITKSVKHKINSKKQVNFRINENDLEKLKSRALVEGIPYQTLLNSIIHKFLNGNLIPKQN